LRSTASSATTAAASNVNSSVSSSLSPLARQSPAGLWCGGARPEHQFDPGPGPRPWSFFGLRPTLPPAHLGSYFHAPRTSIRSDPIRLAYRSGTASSHQQRRRILRGECE
jgi:hypothetical protein